MSEILVIASLRSTPGDLNALIAGLSDAIKISQQEPGALDISAHRPGDDGDRLVLVERWASRESFDEHMGKPHMTAIPTQVGHLLAGPPDVQILQPITIGSPERDAV